jgi:hypothetical protein
MKTTPNKRNENMAKQIAITFNTRQGRPVVCRFTNKVEMASRLAWLEDAEKKTQEIYSTDSGDVRRNYNAELDAIKAHLGV